MERALVGAGRLGRHQPGQDGADIQASVGGHAHGAEQVVTLAGPADLRQHISRQGGALQHRLPTRGAVRRHQALVLPGELFEAGGLFPRHRHGLMGGALGTLTGGDGDQYANPTGGPLDPRADARAFKLLCAKADVPARRLHDLRHSAATMMLENELDLRTAGAVLGPSQVSQTALYSHVLAYRKAVAAERIEKAFFGTRAAVIEK
jgi:integrase